MPRVKLVFKILACETFSVLLTFVGEACGLAMGLVMLGSKSATAIEEMVGVSLVTFSPQ